MLLFTGCASGQQPQETSAQTTAAPLDAEQSVSERPSDKKEKEKISIEVKVAGEYHDFSPTGSKMQLPESVVTRLNGRQGTLVLGIRGEDIKLDPQNLDLYKDNIMSATVDSVEVMGK